MKARLLSFSFAAVAVCFPAVQAKAQTQAGTGTTPETGVVLTKLSPPIYPPLARQARITGDVKVQVEVREDGNIGSAEVVSGHPILKQAALDSARKSTFACGGCSEALTSYLLTYAFEIRTDGDCCSESDSSPKVSWSGNRN